VFSVKQLSATWPPRVGNHESCVLAAQHMETPWIPYRCLKWHSVPTFKILNPTLIVYLHLSNKTKLQAVQSLLFSREATAHAILSAASICHPSWAWFVGYSDKHSATERYMVLGTTSSTISLEDYFILWWADAGWLPDAHSATPSLPPPTG